MLANLARNVTKHSLPVVERYAKLRVRQGFIHQAFERNYPFFFRHLFIILLQGGLPSQHYRPRGTYIDRVFPMSGHHFRASNDAPVVVSDA